MLTWTILARVRCLRHSNVTLFRSAYDLLVRAVDGWTNFEGHVSSFNTQLAPTPIQRGRRWTRRLQIGVCQSGTVVRRLFENHKLLIYVTTADATPLLVAAFIDDLLLEAGRSSLMSAGDWCFFQFCLFTIVARRDFCNHDSDRRCSFCSPLSVVRTA